MENEEAIRIFSPDAEYGFLSNYFECPIISKKIKWKSIEHYYQAQKFTGTIKEDQTRKLSSPDSDKCYAHSFQHLWRPDWDEVKIEIMREAVRDKFFQSAILAEELIATRSAILIEDSKKDFFWGISDGTGQNMLGKILMKVREELIEKSDI